MNPIILKTIVAFGNVVEQPKTGKPQLEVWATIDEATTDEKQPITDKKAARRLERVYIDIDGAAIGDTTPRGAMAIIRRRNPEWFNASDAKQFRDGFIDKKLAHTDKNALVFRKTPFLQKYVLRRPAPEPESVSTRVRRKLDKKSGPLDVHQLNKEIAIIHKRLASKPGAICGAIYPDRSAIIARYAELSGAPKEHIEALARDIEQRDRRFRRPAHIDKKFDPQIPVGVEADEPREVTLHMPPAPEKAVKADEASDIKSPMPEKVAVYKGRLDLLHLQKIREPLAQDLLAVTPRRQAELYGRRYVQSFGHVVANGSLAVVDRKESKGDPSTTPAVTTEPVAISSITLKLATDSAAISSPASKSKRAFLPGHEELLQIPANQGKLVDTSAGEVVVVRTGVLNTPAKWEQAIFYSMASAIEANGGEIYQVEKDAKDSKSSEGAKRHWATGFSKAVDMYSGQDIMSGETPVYAFRLADMRFMDNCKLKGGGERAQLLAMEQAVHTLFGDNLFIDRTMKLGENERVVRIYRPHVNHYIISDVARLPEQITLARTSHLLASEQYLRLLRQKWLVSKSITHSGTPLADVAQQLAVYLHNTAYATLSDRLAAEALYARFTGHQLDFTKDPQGNWTVKPGRALDEPYDQALLISLDQHLFKALNILPTMGCFKGKDRTPVGVALLAMADRRTKGVPADSTFGAETDPRHYLYCSKCIEGSKSEFTGIVRPLAEDVVKVCADGDKRGKIKWQEGLGTCAIPARLYGTEPADPLGVKLS